MNTSRKAFTLALNGLLLALALVMSWLEQMIPILPGLPPGVKLGLSNIIVMYCLFCLGLPSALAVALLKAGFVFLTRGLTAGVLSASGALLSLLVMWLLSRFKVSYLLLSMMGAIAHNLGQLLAVSLWLSLQFFSYYLPILILSGLGMGLLTGLTLRILMPALRRISPHPTQQ